MESLNSKTDQDIVDCAYTATGYCEDCSLPDGKKCPYEEEESE